MKDLIEFMARSIVDNPDAVVVTEEDADDHIVYHLKVADGDMGRVIGKQGRVANAMRTLLKVAAIRRGARAVLEIGDDVRRDDRVSRGGYDRGDDYGSHDDHGDGDKHHDDERDDDNVSGDNNGPAAEADDGHDNGNGDDDKHHDDERDDDNVSGDDDGPAGDATDDDSGSANNVNEDEGDNDDSNEHDDKHDDNGDSRDDNA